MLAIRSSDAVEIGASRELLPSQDWWSTNALRLTGRPSPPDQKDGTAGSFSTGARGNANAQARGLSIQESFMPSRIQSLRQRAFRRQGGLCCYCQAPMWLQSPADLPFPAPSVRASQRLRCTAEHLNARVDGGSNSMGNIAAACRHCNQTRHRRKSPPEPGRYRELVATRRSKGRWHPAWVGVTPKS